MYTFRGHQSEGWGLAWSPRVQGRFGSSLLLKIIYSRLISSDCSSQIYLWNPTEDSWSVDKTTFQGHSGSVEDLQWSPSQDDVCHFL